MQASFPADLRRFYTQIHADFFAPIQNKFQSWKSDRPIFQLTTYYFQLTTYNLQLTTYNLQLPTHNYLALNSSLQLSAKACKTCQKLLTNFQRIIFQDSMVETMMVCIIRRFTSLQKL
jgi:hypothetical protein